MMMSMKMDVSWVIAPCCPIDTDQCFTAASYFHHHGGETLMMKKASSSEMSVSVRLHDATSQEIAIFIIYGTILAIAWADLRKP
jgi:hypothetical protein